MMKQIPECGHTIEIRCDTEPKRADCTQPCKNYLQKCGHLCTKNCENCELICEPCETKLEIESVCSHKKKIQIKCSDLDKPWAKRFVCKEVCNEILECSHPCIHKCSDCSGGYVLENLNLKHLKPLIYTVNPRFQVRVRPRKRFTVLY